MPVVFVDAAAVLPGIGGAVLAFGTFRTARPRGISRARNRVAGRIPATARLLTLLVECAFEIAGQEHKRALVGGLAGRRE